MSPLWIIAIAVAVQALVQVTSTLGAAVVAWRFRRAFTVPKLDDDDDDGEAILVPCDGDACSYCGRIDDHEPIAEHVRDAIPRERTETGVGRILDKAGIASRYAKRTPPP